LNQWFQDLFKGDIVKTPRQILDQFIIDMETSTGIFIDDEHRNQLRYALEWNASKAWQDDYITEAKKREFVAQIRQPQPINEAA
jgi:hypothetical protein